MAIIDIPTGILPEEIVETLPKTGEENKVYLMLSSNPDLAEIGVYDSFIWYNSDWHPFSFDAKIYGAYFARYQESVNETVAAMEETIAEQSAIIEAQAAAITELEEAVFPKTWVSFEMSISSLIMTELDLVDEEGNVLDANAFATDIWDAEPMTFQAELKNGTYYLKNQDNYALGKSNGDIVPLICDGTETVQLGSVEIVMIQPPKGGKK